MADGRLPIEPPGSGQAPESAADAVDQMRWVMAGARTPYQRPEWASDPTSRCAAAPRPQEAGGFGGSTQSHCVSSPYVVDVARWGDAAAEWVDLSPHRCNGRCATRRRHTWNVLALSGVGVTDRDGHEECVASEFVMWLWLLLSTSTERGLRRDAGMLNCPGLSGDS